MNDEQAAENSLRECISDLRDELEHKRTELRTLKATLDEQAKLLVAAHTAAEAWKDRFDQADKQAATEYGAKLTVQKQVARLQDELREATTRKPSPEKPLVQLNPEHERTLVELERAALEADRKERAEHHAVYMRFMEKQLRSMDEVTAHNAHQRECAAREAAALERIVALLEKADARAEDRRAYAVMD